MSLAETPNSVNVFDFARQRGINIQNDTNKINGLLPVDRQWLPELVRFDDGSVQQHETRHGSDYLFSQINYGPMADPELGLQQVRASRMIATILTNNRTEMAYWTKDAPAKEIAVHRGLGVLAVAEPLDIENPDPLGVHLIRLHPRYTPTLKIPPGTFYAFHAAPNTEALVVSGFYKPPVEFDPNTEIYLDPGTKALDTEAEGIVPVPQTFSNLFPAVEEPTP